MRFFLILGVVVSGTVLSQPTDLWSAYQDAVSNDPVYQTQKAVLQEKEQEIPTARAALLPQLFLNAQMSRTYQDSLLLGSDDYNSNQYTVNFSQAIFNANAFFDLQRAKLSVQAAAALFSAQTQDLIVRLIRAYFDVLEKNELLNYTKSQKKFSDEFKIATEKKYKLGFTTITEFEQAKEQAALFESQLLAAKISYQQSVQNLSNLTATLYTEFPKRRSSFSRIIVLPNQVNAWVTLAQKQNLLLRSAQLSVQAAQEALKTKKMDFLPAVSATTGYSDTNELSTQASGGIPETVRATQVGLSASWSFLEGGKTVSEVKAESARYAQAVADMRKRYLEATTDAGNAFVEVLDGYSSAKASYAAKVIGTSGLAHANAGYQAGVQSIFDLLQAQNRLFSAQKESTRDFYQYVLATILLKEAAGSLSPDDVYQLNNYLYGKKHDKPHG